MMEHCMLERPTAQKAHGSAMPTAQMYPKSQKECGASSAKPEKKEDAKALKSATATVVGAKAAAPTDVEWDVEWDGELAHTTKEIAPSKPDAMKIEVKPGRRKKSDLGSRFSCTSYILCNWRLISTT